VSWKTINTLLGQAALDEAFCQELFKNPVEATKQRHFVLTKEEEEKLGSISARDLSEFSRHVLALFGKE
jgi:hypothetical protein